MELCNCSKCDSQTFNHPNGPLNGRYISSRNKRKHQANDRLQLQSHPFGLVGSQDETSDDLASSGTSSSEELSVFENDLPDVVTISNLLKPLVDELLLLWDENKVLTSLHPEGWFVFTQLLPLVGDNVAIHKTVGFGSHSAQQICAWCKAEASELHKMKVGIRRNGFEIHEAARKWKDAHTLKAQEAI
ncbi:hypothetical protein O181_052007 [Austropuccinia psidii MF-1]|uniref:Uncharacterized protein n=1 Tax=Austropuccinia psidii MF-1 TaxID=1389203 RepID=A0A9Q3HQ37_9BASI|nr:hypothetical protein [Austropuccinia psidii MF-1]